jgi:hypothetical protein
VSGGVVHELPEDLRKTLLANPAALAAWRDITPLARNEFICWVLQRGLSRVNLGPSDLQVAELRLYRSAHAAGPSSPTFDRRGTTKRSTAP